jgi:hypothetical protein
MIVLSILLLAIAAVVPAKATVSPTGRIDYAIEYSPVIGGILMHGGWGPTDWVPKSEMWMLNSSGWSQLSCTSLPWVSSGAPAAAHHTMTYDVARQVMFTVINPNLSSSTHLYQAWQYDGLTWTQKQNVPLTSDGDTAIAYDQSRQVTVLYGSGLTGNAVTLEYNGASWTPKTPMHTPVNCFDKPLLKYDPAIGKTVLVGINLNDPSATTETWTWDGTDWTQVPGTQPPTTALPGGMSYDTNTGLMMLLTTDMQTWAFDGYTWTQKNPTVSPTPSSNGYFSMAYDQTRAVTVFFGGEVSGAQSLTYPTTTWIYNGTTWSNSLFSDVDSSSVFLNYIMAIYNDGITVGCSQTPLDYCPSQNVTRGQMAAFIIRAVFGETFTYTQTPYFTDVPDDNGFFKYVQKMKDMGYTTNTGTYDVNNTVTRGQMAAFIIRAKFGETFTYTTAPYFSDVAVGDVFFKYVQKMKDMGYTTVTGTYNENGIVTRDQMAAFIARAFLGMQ